MREPDSEVPTHARVPEEKRARPKGGAGDGNRTHLTSLEGWRITTMLRPRNAPPSYTLPRSASSRQGASTASGIPWRIFLLAGQVVARIPPSFAVSPTTKL